MNREIKLFDACFHNHFAICRSLLADNDNANDKDFFNQVDQNGRTALYVATSLNHKESVAEVLKVTKVDPNIADKDGKTPLWVACENGFSDVVRELVDGCPPGMRWKVNVNQVDKGGLSPLHLCAVSGDTKCLASLLKSSHLEVNTPNQDGDSALSVAAARGHHAFVKLILTHSKINVNFQNKMDNMDFPLGLAAGGGHAAAVAHLLAHTKTSVVPQNSKGRTALWNACFAGHSQVVMLILKDHRVSASTVLVRLACKHNATSPLWVAAAQGNAECVAALLEHPYTDVNQPSKNGYSPHMIAQRKDLKEITALLECKGATIAPAGLISSLLPSSSVIALGKAQDYFSSWFEET